MGRRHQARECALQLLFELEFNNTEDAATLIKEFWDYRKAQSQVKEYGSWLVQKCLENKDKIDSLIESVSRNWRLARMGAIDRNIIRLAACELLYEASLEPAVIINEAIEVAKKFGGENSAAFVNGILDALSKKISR